MEAALGGYLKQPFRIAQDRRPKKITVREHGDAMAQSGCRSADPLEGGRRFAFQSIQEVTSLDRIGRRCQQNLDPCRDAFRYAMSAGYEFGQGAANVASTSIISI